MGGAVRFAAARCARPLVRRRGRAARAVSVPGRDRHLRRSARGARRILRPRRPRPDQAERRGARRACSATRRRRWKPQSPKAIQSPSSRPPASWLTAACARCSPPSAPQGPCWSTRPAAGWPHRRRSSPRSTVGAGDASLAGYLRADVGGAVPPQRLQMAVAYGSAAAALPGSALPTPAQVDLDAVQVTRLPRSHPQPTRKYRHDKHRLTADHQHRSGPARRRCRRRQAGRSSAGSSTGSPTPAAPPTPTGLIAAAMAREEQSATGLPGGIAIPHCRSPYVDTASIGFARLKPGRRLRRARRARRSGVPDRGPGSRRRRAHEAAVQPRPGAGAQGLRRVAAQRDDADEVVELVDGVLNATPDSQARSPQPNRRRRSARTLVAVTACPTGIAHTYMAADSLVAAAKKAGVDAACGDAGLVGQHAAVRRRPSPAPTPSSSPPTSASRTSSGSQASPSSPPASNAPSTNRTRWSPKRSPPQPIPPPPASGRRERAGRRGRTGRRRRLGHPHPADPADRRELHDPVRRRGRPADRARLPVRRLRDRQYP